MIRGTEEKEKYTNTGGDQNLYGRKALQTQLQHKARERN